jgi:flagellar hook protein FlgE
MGGNLFAETVDSGQALTGFAGDNGKGTISGNSLEMSNVDMATEFVKMITTQRGFQANTKVITTTDSLLGEVIAMKR